MSTNKEISFAGYQYRLIEGRYVYAGFGHVPVENMTHPSKKRVAKAPRPKEPSTSGIPLSALNAYQRAFKALDRADDAVMSANLNAFSDPKTATSYLTVALLALKCAKWANVELKRHAQNIFASDEDRARVRKAISAAHAKVREVETYLSANA
jgi:hypothetical protein